MAQQASSLSLFFSAQDHSQLLLFLRCPPSQQIT
jgi:hypothetical protein